MNTFLPATAAALLCLCLTLTRAAPAPALADAREDLEKALVEQFRLRIPQKETAEQNRIRIYFPRPIRLPLPQKEMAEQNRFRINYRRPFGFPLPRANENKRANTDAFVQAVASAAVRDLLKAAAAEGVEEKAFMERVNWRRVLGTVATTLQLIG